MPVGVALSELRRQLRAEVGQSLNPAQGVNAQGEYDLILARQQQELWESYEWPHLEYHVDVPISSGQVVYDYDSAMPFEAINSAWALVNDRWEKVLYGIKPEHVNTYTTRAWPLARWANSVKITAGKVVPAGQFKVLPEPSQNGTLRFYGQAQCNPLIAEADVCVLDSTLITLFAAAEILGARKAEHAPIKLQKAQQYLRRLLANQGADKRQIPVMSGVNMVQAAMQTELPNNRRFRTPTD